MHFKQSDLEKAIILIPSLGHEFIFEQTVKLTHNIGFSLILSIVLSLVLIKISLGLKYSTILIIGIVEYLLLNAVDVPEHTLILTATVLLAIVSSASSEGAPQ